MGWQWVQERNVYHYRRLRWAAYVARMDIYRGMCDLYRSVGVVRVVKCRWLQWAGYVARIGIPQRGTV